MNTGGKERVVADFMDYNILVANREFYLNADFDLTLRGAPSVLDGNSPTFVHEMSQHFIFAPSKRDSMILNAPLPADFLEYLTDKGMELPEMRIHPNHNPSALFTPFGWNPHTETLNRRYANPAQHPTLEAVRVANSRVFSHAFERKAALESGSENLGALQGEPVGGLFDSLTALETHIQENPSALGWVAKGNHGHAGTANRRLRTLTLGEEDHLGLEILFEENQWVALEPWQDRLQDMSVNFQVDAAGNIHTLRGHELINSKDGAFLGVRINPSGQPPEEWHGALESAATRLGRALHDIGYFGPVSMDAYAWKSPAHPAPILRPWVDINARLSMALPAHGIASRLPNRHLIWIWTKPRKLQVPSTYSGLMECLGPLDFDPKSGTGILAVSPIHLGSPGAGTVKPKRIGFLFSARDEEELVRLRTGFQGAMGRS